MSGRIEDRLKHLQSLPELAPPAALEDKVLAAMARATSRPAWPAYAKAAVWLVVIGAGVLAAALLFEPGAPTNVGTDSAFVSGARSDDAGTMRTGREPGRGDDAAEDPAGDADEYQRLAETSDLLDLLASSIPQRQIMRVSTAGTIVGLEDRIALIDAELARGGDMAPEYRTALMRDRVEVLNALVNVRYAQSRAFTF